MMLSLSHTQKVFTALLLLLLGIAPVPLRAQENAPIRIGSEDFTESIILGQLMILTLQNAGFTVEDQTGSRTLFENHEALQQGTLDGYAEYTGTGYANFDRDVRYPLAPEYVTDPLQVYFNVAHSDLARYDIIWLHPAPANSTYALAITSELSASENLVTMSDFAAYVNRGGEVKLASDEEFIDLADALPLMEAGYNFDLHGSQLYVVVGASTEQTAEALSRGVNGINVAEVFSTDGTISAFNLVMLEDDLGVFLPYQPTPVFRGELIRQHPEIVNLLNPLFASLTNDVLQTLNASVQVEGATPVDVARAYLLEMGFIGE